MNPLRIDPPTLHHLHTTMRRSIPAALCLPLIGFFTFPFVMAVPPSRSAPPPGEQASGPPTTIELSQRLWSLPAQRSSPSPFPERILQGRERSEPSITISGQVVVLQDERGIRGLDLISGRAAWPGNDPDPDPGFLLRSLLLPAAPLPWSPVRPTPGGAIADNQWFGTLDQQLISLNLQAQGRLEWILRPDQLLADLRSSGRITSSPLIAGKHLFLSVCDDRTQACSLICCTLTGEVLWRTAPPSPLPPANGFIMDQLATGNDATDDLTWLIAGQKLLSVNRQTGAILWEQTLLQQKHPSPTVSTAILIDGERIHVLSGGKLHLFARPDGKLLRGDPTLTRKHHFLGLNSGTLVVSGTGVMGIDPVSGAIRWELGGEAPELEANGSGLLLGNLALWPTRSELWQIDIQKGRLLQRIPLESMTGMKCGSLILHENVLLMVDADHCSAFQLLTRKKSGAKQ